MEKINDTDIRIAYENRCYGDLLVAIEKSMQSFLQNVSKEKLLTSEEGQVLQKLINQAVTNNMGFHSEMDKLQKLKEKVARNSEVVAFPQ